MGDVVARRLLIVAGEASGDLHAARLVRELARLGRFEIEGVAGPRMREAGVRALVPAESLAVIGFSGVVARLPQILAARRALLARAAEWRPEVAVLVDYPGFNLRIGPELRRRGMRVFYYIAPQVWAWHPERAGAMARWVDRLAVVFRFEVPIFEHAGVKTCYVGHPLLDDPPEVPDRAEVARRLGLPEGSRWLGLLPGSRPGEVRRHLPTLLECARLLRKERPDLESIVALPDDPALARDLPARPGPGLHVARGLTPAIQAHALACAVASGTATLETALAGTPLAIVYRTGALNAWLARRLIQIPRIGLPNIVAGEEVAPELLQGGFTATGLAATLAPWLDDPAARARQAAKLAGVRAKLGGPGASRRAAEALAELAR